MRRRYFYTHPDNFSNLPDLEISRLHSMNDKRNASCQQEYACNQTDRRRCLRQEDQNNGDDDIDYPVSGDPAGII